MMEYERKIRDQVNQVAPGPGEQMAVVTLYVDEGVFVQPQLELTNIEPEQAELLCQELETHIDMERFIDERCYLVYLKLGVRKGQEDNIAANRLEPSTVFVKGFDFIDILIMSHAEFLTLVDNRSQAARKAG